MYTKERTESDGMRRKGGGQSGAGRT